MTQLRDVYKCSLCGHVIEVAHEGEPTLICCGKEMDKLEAKTQDEGKEKHVPVVGETDTCTCVSEAGQTSKAVVVKVGSVTHPMEEDHYIKFIEVLTADKVIRAELKPGMEPTASFCVVKSDIIEVREYCTKHDLWKA